MTTGCYTLGMKGFDLSRCTGSSVHRDDVQFYTTLNDDKPLEEVDARFCMPPDVRAVDFQGFVRAESGVKELRYTAGLLRW